MAIKTYRPTTQTLRYRTTIVNDDITTRHPHKPMIEKKQRTGGRLNAGDITSVHCGGWQKQKLRIMDFKRYKTGVTRSVTSNESEHKHQRWICLLVDAGRE